ncbi:MAG: hypothetical protein EOP40_16290 [Rubrivivax sp.]|nr:MAG: hypothetical protein EOP40_16290 [Rubrivivax sp.]
MPDPTTTTAAVVATAGMTGAAITGAGLVFGIPVFVILAAVVGAAAALSKGDRIELSVRGLWAALMSYALAAVFGVFGGRVCGALLEKFVEKMLSIDISGLGSDALCALLLALLAHPVILPAISRRMGVEIETRGVGQ